MSESKHTRGPWRSQGWVSTWAYIPIHDARHNLVASMYPDMGHGYTRDEVEANARLIAAAPDMLAACKAAFYNIVGLIEADAVERNGWQWPDVTPDHVHPAAEQLRAAIAKAEGKP